MNGNMNQGHRVLTLLNRKQIDFLDRISKDTLFSTGVKLSRIKVISAFVNALMSLGINGKGVDSEEELEKKIVHKIQDSHSPESEGRTWETNDSE